MREWEGWREMKEELGRNGKEDGRGWGMERRRRVRTEAGKMAEGEG